MYHVQGQTYAAMLPVTPADTLVTYYLSAADQSGRKETFPLIGAPGARSFNIVLTTLPGDANCDGIINLLDVVTMINYLMGLNPTPFCPENADVTGDSLINVLDVIATVNIILGN